MARQAARHHEVKYRFVIDVESDDQIPDTNETGAIARVMTDVFLRDVSINRCVISDITEPVVEEST